MNLALRIDPKTHTGEVQSIAVSIDGRFAVTGGTDKTVRVWDAASGELLRTIRLPAGPDYG